MCAQLFADSEDWYSSTDYAAALEALSDEVSEVQRRMLVAHAETPERVLTVSQLAAAAGYDKPNVTYSQYGNLGRRLAEALDHANSEVVWTRMIGDDRRAYDGSMTWEMYPALAEALFALGWRARPPCRNLFEDVAALELTNEDLGPTSREALVLSRIGQGQFRDALLRFWGACAVTGITEPSVLRASHIRPWHVSSNEERLNPYNGLLLAAHLDALFDSGLVTFAADGSMSISDLLAEQDHIKLGLTAPMSLRTVAPATSRTCSTIAPMYFALVIATPSNESL